MRIVNLRNKDITNTSYLGLVIDGYILSVGAIADAEKIEDFPLTSGILIYRWEDMQPRLEKMTEKFREGDYREFAVEYTDKILDNPMSNPTSCRDAYAFRQHVESARKNRGVGMIPEFDEYPIFYFTNHNAVKGPGNVTFMPDHFQKLDFELEAAVIIGKFGQNIKAEDADDYIFGYTIMNDWSARTLQMEEMLLNLGPAKGKDFCTTVGPMIVTRDELEPFVQNPPKNHVGERHNLKMTAKINGVQVSEGNLGSMDWTFAEIIERASYGVHIFPTEIIGSGTVGTGCLLELNGTAKLNNPSAEDRWLKEGDVVELEIEQLGILKNTIHRSYSNHSILDLKKPRVIK